MGGSEIATKISTAQLQKPAKDTNFAQASAKVLMDIVEQNKWSIAINGNQAQKHLKFEAWQTAGKYYGYTVKTGEANYVEYGGVKGFEAKAWVIDSKTGIEIGGAEAVCLSDEKNWKDKPLFQLKSMAQTRAGSKALRQILGFVVALAGYSPTPAEEMIEGEVIKPTPIAPTVVTPTVGQSIEADKCVECGRLISEKVYAYSTSRMGRALCMDCQKTDGKPTEAPNTGNEVIDETLPF